MIDTCRRLRPEARIDGVVIQPMIDRRDAFELILGIGNDAVFGPVILFGAGGTSVEIVDDKALALPPLDPLLAADMIARTRIARLLGGYRERPGVNQEAIIRCLVALSSLSADFPEISELDINPLLATETGVIALDARIVVAAASEVEPGGNPRFAIRPYPSAWVSQASVRYGEIVLRPIRPEDEALYQDFVAKLTPKDIRFRFFGAVSKPTHRQLARLTQIDYAREIAFVAIDPVQATLLGVARAVADAEHEEAEFAIIVRSDAQGQGIGHALMRHLIDYAAEDGLSRLWGTAFDENRAIGKLAADLGFVATDDPQDSDFQRFVLDLGPGKGESSYSGKKLTEFISV